MGTGRLFFPAALIDQWLLEGRVQLGENELVCTRIGLRFELVEAVRVLSDVSGSGDPAQLVGRVETVTEATARGAEVLDRSLILGETAYEVVPGFLADPVGAPSLSTADVVARVCALAETSGNAEGDEELLARYLMQKLE